MQHTPTKIQLSKEESVLVNDAQILLTKNGIINKVYELFGQLAEQYQDELKDISLLDVIQKPPKISKGENYEGLPYVMLDYPRIFLKDDTLAIRTFFWWGNFFSITLQVSGSFKTMVVPKLVNAAKQNLLSNWYVGINDDKWKHDFTETNYALLPQDEMIKLMQAENTLKLAKKIPLTEWDNAVEFFTEQFKLLAGIMKS